MNRRDFLKLSAVAAATSSMETFGAVQPPSAAKTQTTCFRVKPHVQLLDETTVAVVWITNRKSTGYVTWSQDGWATKKTSWRETDGLLDANSCIHSAVIRGFDSTKRLDYKVHSRVIDNFQKVSYTSEEEVLTCVMKPILPSDGAVTWAMFNDVHENLAVYDRFLPHLSDISAFCVFNGDILNRIEDEKCLLENLHDPLSRVSQEAGLPVWYLRGNHETRGAFARNMRDYLFLKNNRYYGATTIGGVRFAFIDTGEDKVDSHWTYAGLVDFNAYLAQECAWLEQEIASPEWKNARARVVIRHIPWGGGLKRLVALDRILAGANVTLALGAHRHVWRWYPPRAERPYPLIVGGGPRLATPENSDNATLVKCRLDGKTLSVKLLLQSGAVAINEKINL